MAKVGEDLRQVVGRNGLELPQFLDPPHIALCVGLGELGEDPAGVFDLEGEFHGAVFCWFLK